MAGARKGRGMEDFGACMKHIEGAWSVKGWGGGSLYSRLAHISQTQ